MFNDCFTSFYLVICFNYKIAYVFLYFYQNKNV